MSTSIIPPDWMIEELERLKRERQLENERPRLEIPVYVPEKPQEKQKSSTVIEIQVI